MPIIVITATKPVSGDGAEEFFQNLKDLTRSPVYAIVLGKILMLIHPDLILFPGDTL